MEKVNQHPWPMKSVIEEYSKLYGGIIRLVMEDAVMTAIRTQIDKDKKACFCGRETGIESIEIGKGRKINLCPLCSFLIFRNYNVSIWGEKMHGKVCRLLTDCGWRGKIARWILG
jgi:hypothetical protein